MITTSASSQAQILQDIMQLHNGGEPFQADLTYGNGGFWKGCQKPEIRGDLNPDLPDLTLRGLDVRDLPFRDGQLSSVVFDPPFIHAHGAASIMGNRFGSYPSQQALRNLYGCAARELSRVVAPGGLLVWKCQDIVESGKQVWNHIMIFHMAVHAGFDPLDLFILTRKNAIVGHNHHRQQHARRTHSYFWVFRR